MNKEQKQVEQYQNEYDANQSMQAQTYRDIQDKRKAGEKYLAERREYKERLSMMAYLVGCGVVIGIILSVLVMK